MKRILALLSIVLAALAAPAIAAAQDGATVTLLHGIPGVSVDIAVDGAVVIEAFEPGTTQDLSSFAGQTLANVEVRAAGTDEVVIGPIPEFPVPDSGNWTALAHLDADGNPTITPFENNTAPTADGQGQRHRTPCRRCTGRRPCGRRRPSNRGRCQRRFRRARSSSRRDRWSTNRPCRWRSDRRCSHRQSGCRNKSDRVRGWLARERHVHVLHPRD